MKSSILPKRNEFPIGFARPRFVAPTGSVSIRKSRHDIPARRLRVSRIPERGEAGFGVFASQLQLFLWWIY